MPRGNFALEDAPEGVVRMTPDIDSAVNEMVAGDLVVCRVNAELIGVAYKLLKRGVKAVVRGRDIGTGLTKLVEQAERKCELYANLSNVIASAGEITAQAVEKFNAIPNGRGEMRVANAQDRYDCLCELAQGVKTVDELKSVITRLFDDFEEDGQPKNAVVLGTVHRTKGLEGNRVFVLRPDLIPHPMAKRKEDLAQERNLGYVSVTRAKFTKGGAGGELVFVGGWCDLFAKLENVVSVDFKELEDRVAMGMAFDERMRELEDKHRDDPPFPGEEAYDEDYPEWGRD